MPQPLNRGRHARTKGHTFERWVVNQLKPIFPDARRLIQSQIKHGSPDIVAGPYAIEAKHYAALTRGVIKAAQAQVTKNVAEYMARYPTPLCPLVVARTASQGDVRVFAEPRAFFPFTFMHPPDVWVALYWDQFLALITANLRGQSHEPSHDCGTSISNES